MKGSFRSNWENGVVITPATLNPRTGELEVKTINSPDFGMLLSEYFEDENGDEFEVCPECHSHILKTVIEEGVGKHLFEIQKCTNLDCNYEKT